ncbi:alpha/beta hydrolase family protein [Alteromonas oceanisediminis]|uniref:alpha/beta hydrolase family protein n=1 Tax=Alteromonas oceanisediminis TaxID=2836180 RepID=UPI001BDB2BEE|nr:alpha/beta hydrolase [Alteromonas oceanisediminis]MBT0587057.1 alpha/beta hydrolase [Alteromonas oceanisediminis]
MKLRESVIGYFVLVASYAFYSNDALAASQQCAPGVYEVASDEYLTITKMPSAYQVVKSDGSFHTLRITSANHLCDQGAFIFEGKKWVKKPATTLNTTFSSGGASFAGQLLLQPNANHETPLVVYAHGSEDTGWIESAVEPYQLFARGISVFIFDKRGTGQSTGTYTQNFPLLADDLVAASNQAKMLADRKFGRFGLVGLSQGGWVAPIASNRVHADFLVIGYGLVADFTEEDADQVVLELKAMGVDTDAITAARQITDVTARMIKTQYRDGLPELIRLKEKYRSEPWLNAIRGSYTGVLISTPPEELLEKGIPAFDSLNVDWSIDPIVNILNVTAPQYWALAEEDKEAPVEKTLARLIALRAKGKDITIRVFPNGGHGMRQLDENKFVAGYLDSQADFIKGISRDVYGNSKPH